MAYTPKNDGTTAKTSDYQLKVSDAGQSFSNEGANAHVTFTLPDVEMNLQYRFIVQSENGLSVRAKSGEMIRVFVLATESGGSISAVTVGATILLKGAANGEWTALSFVGTWS